MKDDLAIAGVFGDQTQALVVQNHLKDAGIPAFLENEFASGIFLVGGGVGGIRVQVPRSRLEEASPLINDRLPELSEPVDWSKVDVGTPEIDPDPEEPTPLVSPNPSLASNPDLATPDDSMPLNVREDRANRIVRGAIIGLFAWPVYFFAWIRLIQIANSRQPLRSEYQRKANVGTLILLAPIFLLFVLFCIAPLFSFLSR